MKRPADVETSAPPPEPKKTADEPNAAVDDDDIGPMPAEGWFID